MSAIVQTLVSLSPAKNEHQSQFYRKFFYEGKPQKLEHRCRGRTETKGYLVELKKKCLEHSIKCSFVSAKCSYTCLRTLRPFFSVIKKNDSISLIQALTWHVKFHTTTSSSGEIGNTFQFTILSTVSPEKSKLSSGFKVTTSYIG